MGPVANKVAEFNEDFVVGSMDFSPDGNHLATCPEALYSMDVHVRDWRSGDLVQVLKAGAAATRGIVRYSPDGTLLAATHGHWKLVDPQLLRIWNVQTGAAVNDLEGPAIEYTTDFAFSHDGKLLVRTASRQGNGYFVAYRTDTWSVVWGLPTRFFIPSQLAVSPDGGFVALAGNVFGPIEKVVGSLTKILVVDLTKKVVSKSIDVFPTGIPAESLAWSPEGRFVAIGSLVQTSANRRAVQVFDVTTGSQVVTEQADDFAGVTGLSYSADGRFLVEGYIDGKVRIWDGAHQALLQEVPVDDHFHTAVALSRDSRYLSVGAGQTVSIWELHR